jgi:pilus assembly protein CpaB
MLGLALGLAILAVVLVRDWLAEQARPVIVQEQKVPMTTVVVARTKLVYGNKIGAEHLREVDWPIDSVPPGSFKTIDELVKPGEQRVVLRTMETGEPVLPPKVTGFGGRASLSAILDKKMRAISISLSAVTGVGGFVLPGDKVDILLSRGAGGSRITDVLLQNVKVLAIDQSASEQQDKPKVAKTVTLEVTPAQAQKLTLAAQVGRLSLTLRSVANSAQMRPKRITVGDLNIPEYNRPPAPKLVEPTPPPMPKPVPKVAPVVPKLVVKATKPPLVIRAKPKPKIRTADQFATVNVLRALKESTTKVPTEGEENTASGGAPVVAPIIIGPRGTTN